MSAGATGALYINGSDVSGAVTGLNLDLGQGEDGTMLILVSISLAFDSGDPSLMAVPGGSAFCSAAPVTIPRDGKPEDAPSIER